MSRNPLGLMVKPGCPLFRVIFPSGRELFFANPRANETTSSLGPPRLTLRIKTKQALQALRWNPSLAFGRGYVSGDIVIEPASQSEVAELIRVFWHYADFDLLAKIQATVGVGWWWLKYQWHLRRATPRRTRPNIQKHYDLPIAFYQAMLGQTMAYSCGIYAQAGFNLDEAQHYKINQTLDWLAPGNADDILDVGCGFGAVELHGGLARAPQARWYGITHSVEQDSFIFNRQFNHSASQRFDVRMADWRVLAPWSFGRPTNLPHHFHKIVSLGQLEHVPRYQRQQYFDLMYELLPPGGRMVLQTIVKPEKGIPDPWINTEIFPLADIPWQKHLDKCIKRAGFMVEVKNFHGPDYARTLVDWYANCLGMPTELWQAAAQARGLSLAAFRRLWLLYLTESQVAFQVNKLNLVRYLLRKPA
jgi:cyclopropane fatty-acyl-phospholipid synthase-like methyltransferase